MTTSELTTNTSAALRERLELLERERATAALSGLARNGLYLQDLVVELNAVRSAFVGAAVTEIASLRGALDRQLLG